MAEFALGEQKFSVGPERERLGFREAVSDAFLFLERQYGFRCVKQDSTFVRYESSSSILEISHGRGSYELSVVIGLRGKWWKLSRLLRGEESNRQGRISLNSLIGAQGGGDYNRVAFQTHTSDGVWEFVHRLGNLVRQYAGPVLCGDRAAIGKALAFASAESEEHSKGTELKRVREKAERAWHERDFVELVQLYSPVEEHLSRSEKMRLKYSRKRLPK